MNELYVRAGAYRYLVKIDENGCWIWLCGKALGYAVLSYKLKSYKVAKLMYIKFFGDVPKGYWICHKCDVRDCINPHHLFAGPPQMNHQDFSFKAAYASDDFNMDNDSGLGHRFFYRLLVEKLPVKTRIDLSNQYLEIIKKGSLMEKRHVMLDKLLYDKFAAHCKENYFPVKRGIELVLANALEANVLKASIKAFINTPSSNPRHHDLQAELTKLDIKEMTQPASAEDPNIDRIIEEAI